MKLFEIPMAITSLVGLCFLAGLGVPAAHADFTFGAPVNAESGFPLFDPMSDAVDCFSADGLETYIQSGRSGGCGQYDLWVYKRASVDDDWSPPENPGPTVNSASHDFGSSITADGLELYFTSWRSGGYGQADLWVARRATRSSPWDVPTNLGPNVNGSSVEAVPTLSSDGLEIYFASNRPGGYGATDFYVSQRATRNDPWGPAANLGPAVNSPATDYTPDLSPDGLLMFFASDRPGGYGDLDVHVARRASRSAPWEPAVNLGPMFNGPAYDGMPCVAPDGSALYSVRDGAGYWKSPILPIVDFNGDGRVDGKEVLAIAQHWGQSSSLCDIAPSAWGDGVVDTNDLIVLASYIGQEVSDPTLIAHWALDETEGTTAADSAGKNDLTVLGNAVWQPAGGKIGGALEFDGKDDFASSGSVVVDPFKGPFSVIAWIKGGVKNRVIVSQTGGADWLYLNEDGMLTTDLMSSDRKVGKTLVSSASLLDDQWHRVVFTWDGTNRILGVDGVEVARDTQPNLAASSGKLNIGAGRALSPTTRWSDLIDDVRVYNRAVQP